MKAALLLFSLLAAHSAAPTGDTSWTEVQDYIAEHAVGYDARTEGALWYESVSGERTWEIGAAGTTRAVDGIGLGWPRTGDVIVLPTAGEAVELAEMIDDFRESQTR